MIEAIARYYERDNSNVHRGLHALSMRATQAYEGARERVARFIKAEIARRNLQKNRYGSDILSLVDKAFAEAQNIKSAGFDLAEARAEMARLHSNITKS